jgi:hypothetical protein
VTSSTSTTGPTSAAWFRADLAGYLRGLSGPELADLLDGLPDP